MTLGKNKLAKKKGNKTRKQDVFLKKVWYDVKAPNYFKSTEIRAGRTCVTKTAGTKIETDYLKERVHEFNLGDLNDKPQEGHQKVKLECMEIQGKACLTDFHSLSFTRDKMCSMIKKKHTLVEAWADCPTADGYVVRLFAFALTKRQQFQCSVYTYAQTAQVRRLRKRMVQVMKAEVAKGSLTNCVQALIGRKIEDEIHKKTAPIFPLDDKDALHIIKAKLVKRPRFDVTKLMEIHNKSVDEGTSVAKEDDAEKPKNLIEE